MLDAFQELLGQGDQAQLLLLAGIFVSVLLLGTLYGKLPGTRS